MVKITVNSKFDEIPSSIKLATYIADIKKSVPYGAVCLIEEGSEYVVVSFDGSFYCNHFEIFNNIHLAQKSFEMHIKIMRIGVVYVNKTHKMLREKCLI